MSSNMDELQSMFGFASKPKEYPAGSAKVCHECGLSNMDWPNLEWKKTNGSWYCTDCLEVY